ncbi:MAG: hypothetical protein II942_05050 [Alphaproteobacteria bacterium]|nr:hypothetical protein [Alphaproteobacteria bacterium]
MAEENDTNTDLAQLRVRLVDFDGAVCAVVENAVTGARDIRPLTKEMMGNVLPHDVLEKLLRRNQKTWNIMWQKAEQLSRKLEKDPALIEKYLNIDLGAAKNTSYTLSFLEETLANSKNIRRNFAIQLINTDKIDILVDPKNVNAAAVGGVGYVKIFWKENVFDPAGRLLPNAESFLIHESTHGAQPEAAWEKEVLARFGHSNFSARDNWFRLAARESEASITDGFAQFEKNGVLVAPNSNVFGVQKALDDVCEKHHLLQEQLWELKDTNPTRYQKLLAEAKQNAFIMHLLNKGTDRGYVGEILTRSYGNGNIPGVRQLMDASCLRLGIDPDAVWKQVEDYVAGKKELKGLEGMFRRNGRLNIPDSWDESQLHTIWWGVDKETRDRIKDFQSNSHRLEDIVDHLSPEERIQYNQLLKKAKSIDPKRAGLSNDIEELIHFEKSMYEKYIGKYADEIMEMADSRNKLLMLQEKYGHANVMKFSPADRDMVWKILDINKKNPEYEQFGLQMRKKYGANAFANNGELLSKAERERWRLLYQQRFKFAEDILTEVQIKNQLKLAEQYKLSVQPSPKMQVVNAGLQVTGRFVSIIGAGHLGAKYREHKDAMANGGRLMYLEEKEKTLARKRADLAVQIGGVTVIGSGLVMTGIRAAGKGTGKVAGMIAEKGIPGVGVGLGAAYGTIRASDGDWLGAALEWTSAGLDAAVVFGLGASATGVGAVAGVPVATLCGGASMAIDTFLAARDGWRHPDGTNTFCLEKDGQPVMIKDENGKEHPAVGAVLNYKNNRREGDAVFFDQTPDGRVIPIMEGSYKNDKKDGEWIYRNENGDIIEIAHYKDGQLVGEYERFDANGNLIAKGNLTNGDFEECWVDENGLSTGIVHRSGQFKEGKPVGEWYLLTEQGQEFSVDTKNRTITTKGDDGKNYTINAQGKVERWDGDMTEREEGFLNENNEIVWKKRTPFAESVEWNIEHGRDPVHYPTIGDPDYMPSMIQGGSVRNAPPMAVNPSIRFRDENSGTHVDPQPGRNEEFNVNVLSNTEEKPEFSPKKKGKTESKESPRMRHEMGIKDSPQKKKTERRPEGYTAAKNENKRYCGRRPGGMDDAIIEGMAKEVTKTKFASDKTKKC